MLKTLNPRQTYTWSPESDPDTVFEYRAYAGPIVPPSSDVGDATRYLVKQFLSYGIVSVTNIEIPVENKDGTVTMTEYEKWEGYPKVDWTAILPPAIQTSLWVEISRASKLVKSEARDLS
jgi:hypothetical protein